MTYTSKRKRSYKRRRPRNKSKRSVKPMIPLSYGFPDTYQTKLRYADTYDLTLDGLTGLSQYQWALNSLYDPDLTGTGAQPTYFDQLAEVYNNYRVYGAMVECTVFNRQTSDPIYMSTITKGLSGAPSFDPVSISMNTNGSKLKLISSEGSNNIHTFRKYYPIGEIFGLNKKAILYQANFAGLTGNFGTGSNPSSLARFYLDVAGTAGGQFRVSMVITYYCQFETPKSVLQS